jgi:two-component system repressor protein LuxO
MLPLPGTGPLAAAGAPAPPPAAAEPRPAVAARPEDIEPLAVVERRHVENAIALCGGNLQLAARRLGIGISTIYRKRDSWAREG